MKCLWREHDCAGDCAACPRSPAEEGSVDPMAESVDLDQLDRNELLAVVAGAGVDSIVTAKRVADALLPVVDRIAREAAGAAWDEGYVAGWRDTEDQPYSDHPSRKTWRPRANPHRAEAADGGGQA